MGKSFSIGEDWTQYEKTLRSSLSVVGLLVAVSMLVVLSIVTAGVLAVAAVTRHEEVGKGEYSLWSLFFPLVKARPLAEKIADILINPLFWAVEIFMAGILIAIVLLSPVVYRAAAAATVPKLVARKSRRSIEHLVG